MNIFNVISLVGGLALFLYGMSVLGTGLEKISSGRMEKVLESLTNNIFKSILLGLVVTGAIQSSSATTVIVVGLVNAGLIKLGPAVGVIMGANIGTTVTGQLLRLGDLENNQNVGFLFNLLKPTTLAPLIAFIGIILFFVVKRKHVKIIGEILLGFAILFYGMFSMEAAVSGLAEVEGFKTLFANLQNPFLGVLVGALVTALIQSSSASVGILQALSSTGAITYSAAFPIIMGQNIGTCITAILASIGANKNAKRAAMVHLYFNVIGTIFFLTGVYSFQHFVGFSFWDNAINRGGIANFHTLFNVVVTICFIPFWRVLEKLATWTIRESNSNKNGAEYEELVTLDERFFKSPSLALQQASTSIIQMGKLAQTNFGEMRKLFEDKFDSKVVERIKFNEEIIDKLEDKLNAYLLNISQLELTEAESRAVTAYLHVLSEFERIGDYTINVVENAQHMYDKHSKFSDCAMNEFSNLCDAVDEVIQISISAFTFNDINIAVQIEPLEEVIDQLVDVLKSKHIERFKSGKCAVESGVTFLDILTNLERMSDHCSNIGVYLIVKESKADKFNRHEYIEELHDGKSETYSKYMKQFMDKYKLEY